MAVVVIKRDGRKERLSKQALLESIHRASKDTDVCVNKQDVNVVTTNVIDYLSMRQDVATEEIQRLTVYELKKQGLHDVADVYIQYQHDRMKERIRKDDIYRIGENIIDKKDEEILKENANMNGDSFAGRMNKIGSEYTKWFTKQYVLPTAVNKAVDDNYVYVHDMDQYALGTTNCIFIPFGDLLKRGFNTANSYIRPPQSIMTAMALVAVIFQVQQNSQYGGVSANKIDFDLAPFVGRSFKKHFLKALRVFESAITPFSNEIEISNYALMKSHAKEYNYAYAETMEETNQAAESLIHNLNTMHSRPGGQVPFTSINYGMCTSPEGRMVARALLLATIKGVGNGETPIFPQHIFQCKKGVNTEKGNPNYDIFKLAIECSSKRMYPNFVNVDAPFNLQYYDESDPDTIIATMGCRTRTIGDRHGKDRLSGKGNLSFNTINLVKLGIEYGTCCGNRDVPDMEGFYKSLHTFMDIATEGLLHRYDIQGRQLAKASDFMMREGVWRGGERLQPTDEVKDVIKHGTLSIGFIGLAECMKALYGYHHGENENVLQHAQQIVKFMRDYVDRASDIYDLNMTLFATPAEGLSGKFIKQDKKMFGSISGVTDREYYTNSFHIPVYHNLKAYEKIRIEAPFHEWCNAGAISYTELDGNARNNLSAFERLVKYALDANVGYFSINHPLDRCPSCGYEGVIGSECPKCDAHETTTEFNRLRRVTGYLTGNYTARFNAAKQAEVRDRVRHL